MRQWNLRECSWAYRVEEITIARRVIQRHREELYTHLDLLRNSCQKRFLLVDQTEDIGLAHKSYVLME